MRLLRDYLKEARVHHYIKNLLVFLALICSGQLFQGERFLAAFWGFCAFCMLSSSIYVINDIRDVEKDRRHPTKCRRPIAAGRISIQSAWLFAGALLLLTALFNFLVFQPKATALLALYFVLNLGYSFGWKNIPLVDVTILVSGFLLRILYGSFISGITLSNWLFLTCLSLMFYFALGKRRNELRRIQSGQTRAVLQHYTEGFLDKNMYLCLALCNVFYALWCMDSQTIASYNTENLVWTAPIVLLISMKYSLNVEGNSDGDPVEVLLHDKFLLLLCCAYAGVMLCILYG